MESKKSLMIFGHPSHELAVLGLIQRDHPDIIFLTDGGCPSRLKQSREGLRAAAHQGTIQCFDVPEASLYDALLGCDKSLPSEIASSLRRVIVEMNPERIYCDAVEHYNPVHDITLPLVLSALRGYPLAELLEVPLVYEDEGSPGLFHIQRVPPPLQDRRLTYFLTDSQLDVKEFARDHIYLNLREQAGPEFMSPKRDYMQREEVLQSRSIPVPLGSGRRLRYENRGMLLKDQGKVREFITYKNHFLPLVDSLLGP
ncbi:MAG: hypothetical protein VKI81_04725 [Synechococcaceae cyanobacterium]|nr:hypothetical protein [Synechococcaceae cyanobacterium]